MCALTLLGEDMYRYFVCCIILSENNILLNLGHMIMMLTYIDIVVTAYLSAWGDRNVVGLLTISTRQKQISSSTHCSQNLHMSFFSLIPELHRR